MRKNWLNVIGGLGAFVLLACSMNLWDFIMPSAYAEIDPKGVAYNESRGMTPKQKATPGPAGELGTYQLTPSAWGDLQKFLPHKYSNIDLKSIALDDVKAQGALIDYLGILHHYAKTWGIQPTDENILQMWNIGPGNFRNGKRNQAYVDSYYKGIGR